MKRPPAGRLVAMLVAMMLAFAAVGVRLAFLQVGDQRSLSAMGMRQRVRTIDLPAERGEILDRNQVPLAVTVEATDVYANPAYVTDPIAEAQQIAPILGLKSRDVEQILRSDETFVYVARQVDNDVAERIEALALPGLGFLSIPKRLYPAGDLASQLLGFVGVDDTGLAGLEYQYDNALAGTPGTRTTELSNDGLPISGGVDTIEEPIPGVNLVTTIDRQMQFRVQTALRETVERNGAKGGTVVVMDPLTGDVYAMANYPSFDPNEFAQADPDVLLNRALTDAFEPGSVNKIITAAAAIENGSVGLYERFRVPAQMQVGPFTIHDSHEHPVESMTIGDIIAESSNIGAAMVAEQVGSTQLADYMERFGYGETTGTGFPGETPGTMPGAWDDVIRATVSYGQGIAVSPMQMAGVYATIANGGTWVAPRLVRGTVGADGSLRAAPAAKTREVVTPTTADLLTRMLAYVVEDGTGAEAQIPGYQVAGKTGTSRKLNEFGSYEERYMASFVGFLPAGRPRLVIAVSIDEPDTVYGGVAAAPLFKQIAQYAIQRLGIPSAPPVALPPHAQKLP
jgi:cell division protein FtsI (penicillin-binding protein 3)